MTLRRAALLLALTLAAAYFVSGAANAATVTSAPCLPKVQWQPKMAYGALPAGVSTRYDSYATWVCEQPAGYAVTSWLFAMSDVSTVVLNYARGLWTKAAADTDCALSCVDSTATEATFILAQLATYLPKATASGNGGKTTRSVFAAKADGTLNPTAVAQASVKVGSSCNPSLRLVGTAYYSVAGLPNASQPGQVLGSVYTQCVVSLAIGSN